MTDVSIEKLHKSFGKAEVLKGIDLAIAHGEFVAILGESGCGKSTLLRIVAGLDDETSGRVLIGGRDVAGLSPIERDIAMVFQSYALYPHMTARANIAFPLELAGMGRPEIDRRVDHAAGLLNLTDHLGRRPRELSGGQRQRVAMGRAIVREPGVFLFDEPLSNLDAKLRVQMRSEIRELQQRLAVTSIYVTHDQVEAMTMADRVALMNAGQVEQFAAPLELYDRPASLYVAAFVGAPPMNLLSLERDAGQHRLSGTSLSYAVPAARAVLGIRPEHLLPCDAASADAILQIRSVENTGERVIAAGEIAGQPVQLASPDRLALAPGDAVPMRMPPDRLHLFDADSGKRIAAG